MAKSQIWQSDKDGTLYHTDCFEPGESKDGFTAVNLNDLDDDDECEECGGVFLRGLAPGDDDDESDEEDEED